MVETRCNGWIRENEEALWWRRDVMLALLLLQLVPKNIAGLNPSPKFSVIHLNGYESHRCCFFLLHSFPRHNLRLLNFKTKRNRFNNILEINKYFIKFKMCKRRRFK